MEGTKPVLSISNLEVARGGRTLFKGLSLELCIGAMVTLQGKNGCGKTTLLDCISRIHNSYTGSIVCRARNVARLPQGRVGFWNLTVAESISVSSPALSTPEYLFGGDRFARDRYTQIDDYIRSTRLEDCRNQKVCELSGGQLQKLKFAQILATSGDLILLDEPFDDLDGPTLDLECSLLVKLLATSAIVLVTHVVPKQLVEGRRVYLEDPVRRSDSADPVKPKTHSAAAGQVGR